MKPEKRPVRHTRSQKILPYTRVNVYLLILGFGLLVAGYLALGVKPWNSFASMNIAPILLVLGYCVVLPIAILYHKREARPESQAQQPAAPQQQANPPA